MQNSYRPRMGQSVYSSHRAMLLAMTASVALLVGMGSSAQAFPLDWGQQRSAPQPVAAPAPDAVKLAAKADGGGGRDRTCAGAGLEAAALPLSYTPLEALEAVPCP